MNWLVFPVPSKDSVCVGGVLPIGSAFGMAIAFWKYMSVCIG